MKRIRNHSFETAQGKIFVVIRSLIVQTYLLRQLKEHMQKNGLILRNILLELPTLIV